MTGYPAKSRLIEWLHPLWRCQRKGFNMQIEDGVKYFDIRIRFDKNNDVVFCHGMADVEVPSWMGLCFISDSCLKYNARCRIIIERGKDTGIINRLETNCPFWRDAVDFIAIKKGWKVLYNARQPKIIDYSYVPFVSNLSPWDNMCRLLNRGMITTIKRWARTHNPRKDYETLKTDTVIHFMDHYDLNHDNSTL